MGPDCVRLFDYRARVLDAGAPEQHQRQRHEDRALVDRVEQLAEIVSDRVRSVDVDDLGAIARESLEHVHVGWELELGQDNLAALAVVAETRRDDSHRHRHVLMHRDRAWRHAEDRREEIAGRLTDFHHPSYQALTPRLVQVSPYACRFTAVRRGIAPSE